MPSSASGGVPIADRKYAAASPGCPVLTSFLTLSFEARLLDEMHLAVSPILLGSGEHLLAGLDLPALGYRCAKGVAGEKGMHYVVARD